MEEFEALTIAVGVFIFLLDKFPLISQERYEMINYYFMNNLTGGKTMKKIILIIVGFLVLLIITPVLTNYLMKISIPSYLFGKPVSDQNTWILFLGSYFGGTFGALIAGFVAYYIARYQINKQNELNQYIERERLRKDIEVKTVEELGTHFLALRNALIEYKESVDNLTSSIFRTTDSSYRLRSKELLEYSENKERFDSYIRKVVLLNNLITSAYNARVIFLIKFKVDFVKLNKQINEFIDQVHQFSVSLYFIDIKINNLNVISKEEYEDIIYKHNEIVKPPVSTLFSMLNNLEMILQNEFFANLFLSDKKVINSKDIFDIDSNFFELGVG